MSDLKSKLLVFYVTVGVLVCLWFGVAAAKGWRAPDLGFVVIDGSGRSYGGSWGGGK